MNNREFFNSEASKNRNTWLNADSGNGGNNGGGQRRPPKFFVIKVVNGSAPSSDITNVDIGDSYNNRTAAHFGQDSNVTITSSIPGVSYVEWLAQTESRPFMVGKTEFISSTANQLNEVFTITHRNAGGDLQSESIQADLDPYQKQTDRVVTNFQYIFDGYSRIRTSNLLAGSTLIFKIWPEVEYSATQEVAGRGNLEFFNMPRIF